MELDFNKIFVIESLPDNEVKTGTNLHNDIIRRRMWSLQNYDSELVLINSKVELFNLFEMIKTEIRENNVIPFLHFEIHGNPSGFVLKSNEKVTWLELHHRFIELNLLVNLKVWVSLATCYGAYIYSIIKPTDRAPFYGYIGAWNEINIEDLSASFERFFDELLESFDINNALIQLNLANPNLPVEYKVYGAIHVFNRIYYDYEKTMYEPENFRSRIEEIVRQGIADPQNQLSPEFFRFHAERMLIEDKEYYKEKYRNQFLLIDIFPENSVRFL